MWPFDLIYEYIEREKERERIKLIQQQELIIRNSIILEQRNKEKHDYLLSIAKQRNLEIATVADIKLLCNNLNIRNISKMRKAEIINIVYEIVEAIEAAEIVNKPLEKGNFDCPICLESNIKLSVLNPCGHGFCEICIINFKKCPICKVVAKSKFRLYVDSQITTV